MNRKQFISSLIAAGIVLPGIGAELFADKRPSSRLVIPPYLRAGDTIGITSPAGYINPEQVQSSVEVMQSWGYNIVIGKTIGKRHFSLGGSDAERAEDFQEMLDNPAINAIMCARGGYGVGRIIDKLDFTRFSKRPKWIIGFSDITVFHCHLNRRFNIASLHSKMCNSFPDNWNNAEQIRVDTILSIKKALSGERMYYTSPPSASNREGTGGGPLVGGNLTMIVNMAGSRSDITTKGKILFIEDTGEQLYSLDRMFSNMKRTGKLSELSGLILGGFNPKAEPAGNEFGKTLEEIVLEKVQEYNYPVCFNFPVGHQKNNFALKVGVPHYFSVNALGGVLQE